MDWVEEAKFPFQSSAMGSDTFQELHPTRWLDLLILQAFPHLEDPRCRCGAL